MRPAKKKGVKERDLMKRFIADHTESMRKEAYDGYWLRLEDGMFGNFKPSDAIFFGMGVNVMVEFKVERRMTYAFGLDDISDHQRLELGKFENGRDRFGAALVYHVRDRVWNLHGHPSLMCHFKATVKGHCLVEKWI